MKRILSLFLAVLMVMAIAVTAIPTAFAAGNTTEGADDAYFKIGDQYYTTLKAALTDAKDGDTIEMLKNFDDSTTANLGTYSKNLTINGNGFTYTAKKNTNAYWFYISGGKTLTINNLNLIAQSGVGINGAGGTINLNDCNFLTTHRMAIRTSGAKYAEFNLNNTVLEINSDTNANGAQAEPLVYLDGTDYNILNLTGTSKLIRSTKTTGNRGNCSIINVVGGAGYVEINLGSEAEIVMNQATGATNAPIGIHHNAANVVALNLENGSTFRVNSKIQTAPVFLSVENNGKGYAVNDKGCNWLVSDESAAPTTTYLSDLTTFEELATSPETGYTAYTTVIPEANNSDDIIRYFNGTSVLYTYDLKVAMSGAVNGSSIIFLGDVTQKSENGMCSTSSKAVSFIGNGYTLTLNDNTAGGTFPFQTTKNTTIANFEKIATTTGGLQVHNGTTVVTNTVIESGNRAGAKMSGGAGTNAHLIVKDAEICTNASAPNTEAVVIFENAGTYTLTLREGAELRRNNPSKGNVESQASVLYAANAAGNYTINMESGSKMATAPMSGNAACSVIAFNNTAGKMTINMEEGAYLVSESSVLTTLHFVYANVGAKIKLNAPADAFLATSATTTVPNYNEGAEYGGYTGTFAKKETSDVPGYDQYVLTRGKASANKFKVVNAFGDTVYVDTMAKVFAFSTATVTMLEDVNESGSGYTVAAGKNITLDLNGKKYTNTASSYVIGSMKGNLTIKNGTFSVKRGIVVQAGGVLNFDGATASSTERPLIKLNGAGTTTANINNSNLSINANGENLILIEQGTDGFLNVTGNSVLSHVGAAAGRPNCSVITVQQNNVTDADVDATITIGAGAKLHSAYALDNSNKTNAGACILDMTYGKIDIILEKDSILAIDRKFAAETYFIWESRTSGSSTNADTGVTTTKNGKTTITDKGAIYSANATALANGVHFPAIAKSGETQMGFLGSDGKFYHTGKNVATAEETVTFSPIYYGTDDFGLVYGASLRTIKNEIGIRFSGYFSDLLKNTLGNNVTFGMAIAPGKTTADDPVANTSNLFVKSTKNQTKRTIAGKTYENVYHVAVIYPYNFETLNEATKTNAYFLSLATRAYFEITYADGSTVKYYTTLTSDNIRCMAQIAQNLDDTGETNDVITDIVNTIQTTNVEKYYNYLIKNGTGVGVVYPSGASDEVMAAANKIAAKLGVTAKVAGTYNANTVEIVVGNVNYTEVTSLTSALGYFEGAVKVSGKKVVVAGYDDTCIALAADKLIANISKKTLYNGDVIISKTYEEHVSSNTTVSELPRISGYTLDMVDTADNCYMLELGTSSSATSGKFSTFKMALENDGYSLYAYKTIEKNSYYTYTNGKVIVTLLSFTPSSSTQYTHRLLVEPYEKGKLPTKVADNKYTPISGLESTITQVGLWYASPSKPLIDPPNSEGREFYNYFNGMSYVIRLADGSFIVVDGGHNNPVSIQNLYDILKKQAPNPDNIVVAAWFLSHNHDDHIGFFSGFASKFNDITVERFVYNFPAGSASKNFTDNVIKYYPEASIIKAHPGQEFNIRNAKITMLYTADVYTKETMTDTNNASIVWKMELNGKTFMCLGDYSESGDTLMKLYTATTLKSDIVQVAHHGISGMSNDVYVKIAPEYAFWPVANFQLDWNGIGGNKPIDLTQGSKYTMNKYILDMPDEKVFVARDDVAVMTISGGKVTTNVYDTVSAYVNN